MEGIVLCEECPLCMLSGVHYICEFLEVVCFV